MAFRECVFLLIERGHANVYTYGLGWFYEMLETFVAIQKKRTEASEE